MLPSEPQSPQELRVRRKIGELVAAPSLSSLAKQAGLNRRTIWRLYKGHTVAQASIEALDRALTQYAID